MSGNMAEAAVYFNAVGYEKFNSYLKEKTPTKIFVLVDSNSHNHCLASFLEKLHTEVTIEILEIPSGEESKDLETCQQLWNALSELGGDRKSLLVNLGGGVITDLGGFVASAFKRGIPFVHFPTTLLAMVDAAIGGKNGINLGNLKNQIGVIQNPEMVVADTSFLSTLPASEMRSGLAEMLKHGLIADEDYWNRLNSLKQLDVNDLDVLIKGSVDIKQNIVEQDPREAGLRKSLNFGHTLGHAIESYFMDHQEKPKLLHGEAVAAGMVLATYLSSELEGFPKKTRDKIRQSIHSMYGILPLINADEEKIIELMKFDKKNEAGKINFVLLRSIGEPVIDREVPNELIYDAFRYYQDSSTG